MKIVHLGRIAIVFAAVFLMAVSAAFGQTAGETPEDKYAGFPPDMKRIFERGKLIVAMYHKDIPPFMYQDDKGNFRGFDVDMARDIAEKLGVEIEFNRSPQTFNEIVDAVASHQADLGISLISATLARAEKVRFSRPYLVLHPTLIVNRLTASSYSLKGKDPLKDLRNTDKKIGEKKGTSYVGFAKNIFTKAKIVEYEDWDPTMAAVLKGDVIAALRDEIGVKNYILQSPDLAIRLQMIVLKDLRDPLGIAVPSDSTHLLDWINIYLDRYQPQITADDLLQKYADIYEKK